MPCACEAQPHRACAAGRAKSSDGAVRLPLSAALAASLGYLLLLPLQAHPLAPSLLELKEADSGIAQVLWRTPILQQRGVGLRPRLPDRCRPVGGIRAEKEEAAWVERWTVQCQTGGLAGGEILVEGLERASSDVVVRVVTAEGRSLHAVLNASRSRWHIPPKTRPSDVLRDYLLMGVEHIITGFDHLLFVFGLLLLVSGWRRLVAVVTFFTLGHSVTLCLAALDLIRLPQAPVEAAIALSILVLAIRLAGDGKPDGDGRLGLPQSMAAAFGLLHGLGFAGALAEVGLPSQEIPIALLSFNLGIEIGQLGFVLLIVGLGRLAAPLLVRLPRWSLHAPAYVMGSLSVYWMLDRVS